MIVRHATRNLDLLSLSWWQLGLKVIKLGANLTEIGAAYKFGNYVGRQATPFLTLLMFALEWQWVDTRLVCHCIREWACMVQKADIDLVTYGRDESRAWAALGVMEWPHENDLAKDTSVIYTDPLRSLYPVGLQYGEHPDEWNVVLQRTASVIRYELSEAPGTFEPNPVHVICWPPGGRELQESVWIPMGSRRLAGQSVNLSDMTINTRNKIFEALVGRTQDDTGFISHMDLRSQQRTACRPRSKSQPAPQKWDQLGAPFGLRTEHRAWLPTCHWCPVAGTYRMDGSCKSLSQELQSRREPRECFEATHSASRPIFDGNRYATNNWSLFSFLAGICQCQQGRPGRCDSRPLAAWLTHTGTEDCPQGCRKVRLDSLHVPEDLWESHPRTVRRYW